jgi:hypothetical protein
MGTAFGEKTRPQQALGNGPRRSKERDVLRRDGDVSFRLNKSKQTEEAAWPVDQARESTHDLQLGRLGVAQFLPFDGPPRREPLTDGGERLEAGIYRVGDYQGLAAFFWFIHCQRQPPSRINCSTDSPCHSAAVFARIHRLGSRESGYGLDAPCILFPSLSPSLVKRKRRTETPNDASGSSAACQTAGMNP